PARPPRKRRQAPARHDPRSRHTIPRSVIQPCCNDEPPVHTKLITRPIIVPWAASARGGAQSGVMTETTTFTADSPLLQAMTGHR
ncbi:hypothetical protein GPV22_24625, partial [Salmonella enterica subsp. enterica serovar Typhimurium]|nr:hypothetical protein [Salmonella enterica subsp. enterica serovar Typhimurium]